MNISVSNTKSVYIEDSTKTNGNLSSFFSWLTSLFHKKVKSEFIEQDAALNLLERNLKCWSRGFRQDALATLHGIDTQAYKSMKLSSAERFELQSRVEDLKDKYKIQRGGINFADIEVERAYEISTKGTIQELVQQSQSRTQAIAREARKQLLNLEVTSPQNSESLNNYLIEELTKAQEAVQALINSEAIIAEQLERERNIIQHKERLTGGGKLDLNNELNFVNINLLATPFSQPILNEYNAFAAVEELAEMEPSAEALHKIEKQRDMIIQGGAGKELERALEQMSEKAESRIEELGAKLKKTQELYNRSAPYSDIYLQLQPLREAFSRAFTLRSLDQMIALIESRIIQLENNEDLSTQSLVTDAIDPFQAQQIIKADDPIDLEERMERLTEERERLAARFGLHGDLFEEGQITLRQTAAKPTLLTTKESAALHQEISDLGTKQRIYTLVLDENEEAEKIIGEMKAQALMESRPDLADKIGVFYQEALDRYGYLFETLSAEIEKNREQIERLKMKAKQSAKSVTVELPYTRLETLSFSLQSLAAVAKNAIKELYKAHPKLAKQLKKVPLRELSDATKLGAKAEILFQQRVNLVRAIKNEQYFLERIKELKSTPRSASTQ